MVGLEYSSNARCSFNAGEHRYGLNPKVISVLNSAMAVSTMNSSTSKVQNQQVKADLKMDSQSDFTQAGARAKPVFKVNLGQSQPAATSIEAGNGNSSHINTEPA